MGYLQNQLRAQAAILVEPDAAIADVPTDTIATAAAQVHASSPSAGSGTLKLPERVVSERVRAAIAAQRK